MDEDALTASIMQILRQQTAIGHFPKDHIALVEGLVRNWLKEQVMPQIDPYAELRERVRKKLQL